MEHRFYLGIDLDDQYAVISSYELNKKEPETFSAIAGSEIYQIPALITKKKGIGQWFVGEEAVRLAIAQGEEANGRLLSRAVGGEKVFVDGETCRVMVGIRFGSFAVKSQRDHMWMWQEIHWKIRTIISIMV